MRGPRWEGEGCPRGAGPSAPGGPSGRGSPAVPRAGGAWVPPRDRDRRAGRPLTAGSGEGLGGLGRGRPPLPATGQWRGEENGTHNKETEAHRGGSRGPRTVRVSRDKGATGLGGGGVLRPHPPPPTPNRPVRGDRPRVGPRRCPGASLGRTCCPPRPPPPAH